MPGCARWSYRSYRQDTTRLDGSRDVAHTVPPGTHTAMPPAQTMTAKPRAAPALDVLDPATGELVGRIPAGSAEAVDAAVRAARAAQPAWARTPPAERAYALKAA